MSNPTFENGALILAVAVRMRLGEQGIECGPLTMRLYDRRPVEAPQAIPDPPAPRPISKKLLDRMQAIADKAELADGETPSAKVVPFRKH